MSTLPGRLSREDSGAEIDTLDFRELAPTYIADGVALTLATREASEPRPPAPYGTVAVAIDGQTRRIAAARRAPAATEQAPAAGDLQALTARLDAASRLRLLRFLLGFCRSAFQLGAMGIFADTCRRLLAETIEQPRLASPVARLGEGMMLLRGLAAPAGSSLHVLGRSRVFCSAMRGSGVAGDALQAIETVSEGDLVFADCDTPACWIVGPAATLPHVLERLRDRTPEAEALRRAAIDALMRLARPGNPASALLRDIQSHSPLAALRHTDPVLPIGGGLELALSDHAGGLFLRGWLRDPHRQIERVELLTAAGATPLPVDALHRLPRPDLADAQASLRHRGDEAAQGFVAHVRDPSDGHTLQPQLRLMLRSGVAILLTPPARSLPADAARDAVLAAIPPNLARGAIFDDCIVPAARALHRAAMAEQGQPVVLRLGAAPPSRPLVSLLIPIYRNLGFVRFQLAALAQDPAARRAEIIVALDSREQAAELEHLLRGLAIVHDLSVTLVIMPRNLGFAAATNTAARQARAPMLLMLNSDVVPAGPGWLAPMLAAANRPRIGAVGPKLLFDDNSIQHAGLFFERDQDGIWFNRHYHKGMPRYWAAACRARAVPAVTGGALMIRTSVFERLGGVDEAYIIGDYEDSDLCLKLQEAGRGIAYAAGAELYHFERRSIALHGGYARTLAAQYNRTLHHARWNGLMTTLMARTNGEVRR